MKHTNIALKKEQKRGIVKMRLPQEDYGVTGINNCLLVFHPAGDAESQFATFQIGPIQTI